MLTATLAVAVPRLVRTLSVVEIAVVVVLTVFAAVVMLFAVLAAVVALLVALAAVAAVLAVFAALAAFAAVFAVFAASAAALALANSPIPWIIAAVAPATATFLTDSLDVVSLKAVLPTSSRVPRKLPSRFNEALGANDGDLSPAK